MSVRTFFLLGPLLFASLFAAPTAEPPSVAARPGDKEVLLYTYFLDGGKSGVRLAAATSGNRFEPINNNQPVFLPPGWPGQNLTRDASILYRDGLFRMVWTSEWRGHVFGYAESTDLLTWSTPVMVRPFPADLAPEDQPENVWAPELHYDPFKKDFFIIFASTTARERTDGDGSDNGGKNKTQYDNRLYIIRTSDGKTFTPARLFFSQGFSCIDAVLQFDESLKLWAMIVKCSRNPDLAWLPGRNLVVTYTGPDLDRPDFRPVSAPIIGTHTPIRRNPDLIKSMAEGQSLVRKDGLWWLFWDEPAGGGIQLGTSPDLKTWTHLTDATFPPKANHGTAFFAPASIVEKLLPKPASP